MRATFFIVGRIARDLPHVVEAIASAGHEIACHNQEHLRVYGQTPEAFRAGMEQAQRDLEAIAGQPVRGFRAPDFSITQQSLWALGVLRELGFVYDSSVVPTAIHDVYGMGEADPRIHRLPDGLVEFPLATFGMGRRRLPFGGGGYFRFYPLALTRALIERVNRAGHPFMFFIHPYEVGPEIPVIDELPAVRRFRHYYNCGNGRARLARLLERFEFAPAIDVLRQRGFA